MKESIIAEIKKYNFLNPLITVPDEIILCAIEMDDLDYKPDKDILLLNSKVVGKQNLYAQLQQKYAYHAFDEKIKNAAWIFPLLISKVNEDGKGRHLEFSYTYTCARLLGDPKLAENLSSKTSLEILEYTKEILREKRKKFTDVLNNGLQSQFYLEVVNYFKLSNVTLTKENLKRYIDSYTQIIMQFRFMTQDIKEGKNVTPDAELSACFEPETLALIICKSIIDTCKFCIENKFKINLNISLVFSLCQMFENADLTSFNPKIKYYNYETKRYEQYSIKDLQNDANLIESSVKGLKTINLDYSTIKKLGLNQNSEAVERFQRILSDDDSAEKFIASWDIILPGEKAKTENTNNSKPESSTNRKSKSSIDTTEIFRRRFFLEGTNYKCQIIGKNKFAGYIGFIYESGVVIFEKFYEDNSLQIPIKQSNATYKMNIKNFVEFSQKNKQEIIDFIKNTQSTEIERIYHTKNWENKIKRAIAEITYNESVKEAIEQLLAKQEISKRKTM